MKDTEGKLLTECIAHTLISKPATWPDECTDGDYSRLLHLLNLHGIGPLFYEQIRTANLLGKFTPHLVDWMQTAASKLAAQELVKERELKALLADLGAHHIDVLILKGTALAYSLYANPYTRTRGDTDLWVRQEQKDHAIAILMARGYAAGLNAGGDVRTSEITLAKTDRLGVRHTIDLHWRLNNSPILSQTFSFDELWPRAQVIPRLSSHAKRLDAVDAVVHALIHRITNLSSPYYVDDVPYYEPSRLIWLYDVHLLTRQFSDEQWRRLSDLAIQKKIATICLNGLIATQTYFPISIPEFVSTRLAKPLSKEPSAIYLARGKPVITLTEVMAIPGWHQRLQFLLENAFPPTKYMQDKYGISNPIMLWVFYAWRILRGLFRRGRAKTAD